METIKLISQITLSAFLIYVLIKQLIQVIKFKGKYYDTNMNLCAVVILILWLLLAGIWD